MGGVSLRSERDLAPRARHLRAAMWLAGMVQSITVSADSLRAEPLAIRNLSPVGILYGLPRPMGGHVLRSGATHRFTAEIVSNFTSAVARSEAAYFDGETSVWSYRHRRAVGAGWEAGLDVPYVVHNGGFLDGFIDGWHAAFGLPDAGRYDVPTDQLNLTVQADGSTLVRVDRPTDGIGDVTLFAGRRLSGAANSELALRALAKVPTGELGRLSGSGAADYAAWLDYSVNPRGLATSIAVGLARLGDGDMARQRRYVAVGHFGLSGSYRGLTLIGQLDYHGRLLDGSLDELGGANLQGTLGGRLDIGSSFVLELGIVEDLLGAGTSDVVVHMSLKGRLD